ncbi:sodium-dependent transporter [Pacificimonas sp. WHA3]|uniref:Sodium-dependent transporter n=1 Tax=Pacificimonas pallii TaxID=2827236 RepID=A0ABS6SGF5_9SPHN|nr:sodium-dependent transporter [Pacificimonas pallii]MBV7257489.1 sodium-dependent transporter [Pacificimonas pallii]
MQNRKWTSNAYFLAAAIGSAVGLSNIWKFTYVAGDNGGGAFVLIYVLALFCIALPALIAEFLIGRRGGAGVIRTMRNLSAGDGISPRWRAYGWLAISAVFIALSFYSVVAGWTLDYFLTSLFSPRDFVSETTAAEDLGTLLASPGRMMVGQAMFLLLTAGTVALGIKGGLEKMLGWMMPGLFILLILLVIYAVFYGDMAQALRFMFFSDFSALTPKIVLMAFGQAFFSLGVGAGVLMTIASYMDKETPLVRSAIVVAVADGTVAIVAGLAIFPIVFANGLSPTEGPGLIFATLPVAFGQMPGGAFIGPLFYLLLAFAALTSSITLLDAVVSSIEDITRYSRAALTWVIASMIFLLGLATVFSFNIWADVRLLAAVPAFSEKTIFDLLDYLVSNIMLPVGGISVALLAGWGLSRSSLLDELATGDTLLFQCWLWLVRLVVPVTIGAVFLLNLA